MDYLSGKTSSKGMRKKVLKHIKNHSLIQDTDNRLLYYVAQGIITVKDILLMECVMVANEEDKIRYRSVIEFDHRYFKVEYSSLKPHLVINHEGVSDSWEEVYPCIRATTSFSTGIGKV